jgi:hypothetical protein
LYRLEMGCRRSWLFLRRVRVAPLLLGECHVREVALATTGGGQNRLTEYCVRRSQSGSKASEINGLAHERIVEN